MLANIGPTELIILIAVLVVFFGKKKTSEIARDAGEASLELKKIEKDYRNAIEELKKPIVEIAPIEKPKTEAAPVDAAKAEVTQLAQLAQEAKEKSQVKGGE